MKIKKNKKDNSESGIVLVTVVIMTLVMMILAVAIMSANVNQVASSQHQIERIKAEQLAKGAFWYNFSNLSAVPPQPAGAPPAETLDGKTYTPSVITGGAGPNSTTTYDIKVSYPKTF